MNRLYLTSRIFVVSALFSALSLINTNATAATYHLMPQKANYAEIVSIDLKELRSDKGENVSIPDNFTSDSIQTNQANIQGISVKNGKLLFASSSDIGVNTSISLLLTVNNDQYILPIELNTAKANIISIRPVSIQPINTAKVTGLQGKITTLQGENVTALANKWVSICGQVDHNRDIRKVVVVNSDGTFIAENLVAGDYKVEVLDTEGTYNVSKSLTIFNAARPVNMHISVLN